MSFVEREIYRIREALLADPEGANYRCLYAAQQALAWSLDPNNFRSPFNHIYEIEGGDLGAAGTLAPSEPEHI